MSWQKPARIGVAVIGIASAVAVYLTMGERRTAPPPEPIKKADDKAIVQFAQSIIERFAGSSKDFEIQGIEYSFVYEDGTGKLTGNPITILVRKGETRTVKISGREIRLSKDENHFELTGPVELLDSDGFWLKTDRASVNRVDSIAHVPGAATFGKGRMTGSGVGFSYDENRQILLISQKAQIKTVDDAGKPVIEMTSGTAMLDRLQHLTTLDTNVHVVRNTQVIDTDAANGRLTANNDVVTYVELHGNARVVGGASIERMAARDINLDYTEDGKTLEGIKMAGGSNVAMTGDAGRPGRQIGGETVDLTLAADGMLTSAMARENVRLELPAGADTPQRIITAQTLDGTGEPGKGLTSVTFTRDVSFTERPLPSKAGPTDNKAERTARSQRLEASMANDAVTAATFTGGDVTFEEIGLKACAAQAEYQPQKGTLVLSGATKAGNPIVAQEQAAVEGGTIDVALETRLLKARGDVIMRAPALQRCRPARSRPVGEQGANKVPKLLKSDAPMTITAPSLEYDSRKGHAVYSGGRVSLRQEETTSIAASESLVIDQTTGNLTATGNVRSTLMLDNKSSIGTAHEFRYSDEHRLITYASSPKAGSEVSLASGSDSRILAGSIDLTLAAKENTLERMKAVKNVRLTEGQHRVDGAGRLDYTASEEKYVVTGDGTTPVVVVTLSPKCRQQSGQSVTFYKGTDKGSVSGNGSRTGSSKPLETACTPPLRK